MTDLTASTELNIPRPEPAKPTFSVDRNVPLTLIMAAFVQFAVACGAVGALYSTVSAQGERLARLEAASQASVKSLEQMQIDMARLVERVTILLDRQQPADHAH